MRHQNYLTTAVLIAAKGRKKTNTAIPSVKGIPVNKPLISKHRVAEDGSIIPAGKKLEASVN